MLRVFQRTGDPVTVGPPDADGICEVTVRFTEPHD
jgi:hypothetical protein